ncbi:hypothetical protein [Dictyobacter kobayashii]|uniref:Transposase IS701-like DDE domain-containing protein n=1 Tax=Dictyobacter kobayashii TaxID=2014872 RepID=A0A402ASC1_9CHLR|nr:hypothetical protein [Dictyobacter kobayashii]GCE22018.1 hypothetical protein KDK_58180 [Dictyobacter kobayashii]
MYSQYATWSQGNVSEQQESQQWAQSLETFLAPHCERLDAYLDRRLVGTVSTLIATLIATIIQARVPLTLTALGSDLCGPDHADAGTQRIHRLLQQKRWSPEVLAESIWQQADQHCQRLVAKGRRPSVSGTAVCSKSQRARSWKA